MILISPPPIFFGTLGTPPIEAPLWTTSCKIATNVAPYSPPFQFIHMRVEPLGKPYGIKVRCYLGVFWGTTGEPHVEHIGTHNGNNDKKKKNPPIFAIKNGSNVNSNKTLNFWFGYLRI